MNWNWRKWLENPKAPAWVNLALLIPLSYFAANLTWQILPAPDINNTAAPLISSRSTQPSGPRPQDLANQISQLHLFGNPSKPLKPAVEQATETKLNLNLRGVLAYKPQINALAIIAQANGEEKVYRVGDEVPGNATLAEVQADKVILERGGRYEILRLPESSVPLGKPIRTRPRTAAPQKRSNPMSLSGLTPGELRKQIRSDPLAFSRLVSYVPINEGGKQIGFQLQARENQEILAQLGIMPDDVVVEVNGTRMDSMTSARRLLRDLDSANSIEAKVLRNGVEVPVYISLE